MTVDGEKKKAPISGKGLRIVLGIALFAVAALVIGFCANGHKTALKSLTVYVDGQKYLSSPLIPGKKIIVTQEDGRENVIRMTENGFYMESANCPNRDCVAQGEVNSENWRHRKLLAQVICLPNRVTVALDLAQADDGAAMELPDI